MDVVRVREDADLHDFIQLRTDILVRGKVLLHTSLLSLEIFT